MTVEEVPALFGAMAGAPQLVAELLYSSRLHLYYLGIGDRRTGKFSTDAIAPYPILERFCRIANTLLKAGNNFRTQFFFWLNHFSFIQS